MSACMNRSQKFLDHAQTRSQLLTCRRLTNNTSAQRVDHELPGSILFVSGMRGVEDTESDTGDLFQRSLVCRFERCNCRSQAQTGCIWNSGSMLRDGQRGWDYARHYDWSSSPRSDQRVALCSGLYSGRSDCVFCVPGHQPAQQSCTAVRRCRIGLVLCCWRRQGARLSRRPSRCNPSRHDDRNRRRDGSRCARHGNSYCTAH